MKRAPIAAIILMVLGFGAALAQAQANAPKKKTVYLPPPVGSHLGGGFVDSGETDSKSTLKPGTAHESTNLGEAIASLDARAGTVLEGWALIPTAVSWQTKVPVKVLKEQRSSGLTYGQLLVANSLATGSGNTFDQILALRAKTRTWSQLADSLHINVNSIIERLKAAATSMEYAESRRRLRREDNFKKYDFQRGGRTRDPRGG